jgi:hypothetical protein
MLNLKVYEADPKDLPLHNMPKSNVVPHPSVLCSVPMREASDMSWVVVEDAGSSKETVIREFPFFWQALRFTKEFGEGDIMKRLPDGNLTTDY